MMLTLKQSATSAAGIQVSADFGPCPGAAVTDWRWSTNQFIDLLCREMLLEISHGASSLDNVETSENPLVPRDPEIFKRISAPSRWSALSTPFAVKFTPGSSEIPFADRPLR